MHHYNKERTLTPKELQYHGLSQIQLLTAAIRTCNELIIVVCEGCLARGCGKVYFSMPFGPAIALYPEHMVYAFALPCTAGSVWFAHLVCVKGQGKQST